MAQRIYNVKQPTENTYEEENSKYVLVRCSAILTNLKVKLSDHFPNFGGSISLKHIFLRLELLDCLSGLFLW